MATAAALWEKHFRTGLTDRAAAHYRSASPARIQTLSCSQLMCGHQAGPQRSSCSGWGPLSS